MSYTVATLVSDVTHLMRLPIGDKLSVRAFYDEAQLVLRRAKDAGVTVPPAIVDWLTQADRRAADPLFAATSTAALVEALRALS